MRPGGVATSLTKIRDSLYVYPAVGRLLMPSDAWTQSLKKKKNVPQVDIIVYRDIEFLHRMTMCLQSFNIIKINIQNGNKFCVYTPLADSHPYSTCVVGEGRNPSQSVEKVRGGEGNRWMRYERKTEAGTPRSMTESPPFLPRLCPMFPVLPDPATTPSTVPHG